MGERAWLSPGAGAAVTSPWPAPPSCAPAALQPQCSPVKPQADPPVESVSLPSQTSQLNQRSSCLRAATEKYGKPGGPKHRENYSLIVMEAGRSKPKSWQGCVGKGLPFLAPGGGCQPWAFLGLWTQHFHLRLVAVSLRVSASVHFPSSWDTSPTGMLGVD